MDLDYVAVDLAVGLAADVELFVGLDVVYLFAGLLLDNEDEVREDEEDHVELFLLVDEHSSLAGLGLLWGISDVLDCFLGKCVRVVATKKVYVDQTVLLLFLVCSI